MKEEYAVKSERYERQNRVDQARERLQEERYMERHRKAFNARDDDNGGSLDADEGGNVPSNTCQLTRIVSQIPAVSPDGAHVCNLLEVGEHQEAYEQQNNFAKHSGTPVSIELEASKIKVGKHDFEVDLTRAVDEFMDLADTDILIHVPFEEFKGAIAKSRVIADRFISLDTEGFHKIRFVDVR
ncbi:unnamed protein product [Albugo candida]|uniref:Uncharacterized protein n=1 Tax=Albugo candida TaxID=65357 RepID=A0A024FTC9_9STRA|nr:unnamed protein product [Albugo candida]|eukprot:CCI10355.1 unnamed protein product [Albugo candida]